jgi:hypothetical protein
LLNRDENAIKYKAFGIFTQQARTGHSPGHVWRVDAWQTRSGLMPAFSGHP